MAYTHIDAGREIEVSERYYCLSGDCDISALVKLPQSELEQREKESVDDEKATFEKFKALTVDWHKQAAKTNSYRAALKYLKTEPVKHTNNQWVEGEYGWHERSNMVYKMIWRESENTSYNRVLKKSVPVSWSVSWYFMFNTPRDTDRTGTSTHTAGQGWKTFGSREDMEKYMNGRIAAYSKYFTEVSPPIPREKVGRFSVHGCLLPGYTAAEPERTPQEVAAELAEFLDDCDLPAPEAPDKEQDRQQKPHKHRRSSPTR